MATLVTYTCKSFIELTPGAEFRFSWFQSPVLWFPQANNFSDSGIWITLDGAKYKKIKSKNILSFRDNHFGTLILLFLLTMFYAWRTSPFPHEND